MLLPERRLTSVTTQILFEELKTQHQSLEMEGSFSSEISESGVLLPLLSL